MDLIIDQNKLGELEKAFHLMWETFPEPATLVHKSKKVIAINSACQIIGREKGMNCAQHGPAEGHRGCLANKAISVQQTAWKKSKYGEKDILCYWLPVPEHPDFFIHFGVGVTIDYDAIPVMDPTQKD
ncbi:hypothetical protein [Pelosinus propionicus]|uniref:Uncharacterized protein n=1 Tax=Pelosinus propionicus DSM 13327 TaxID=1123291 RepID=A0A1I4PGU2_9FIRM|nr:hypothetical protein [Pelosinus propionicus]SFM26603.1 hypothetical protein SAMN04490355_10637 [Pelosinus propionicus DSM 13327]